jgi:hypothetical protein
VLPLTINCVSRCMSVNIMNLCRLIVCICKCVNVLSFDSVDLVGCNAVCTHGQISVKPQATI